MIFINCKKWCLFRRYIDKYIVCKLYYREIFDLVILIVVDITSEVLFDSLVKSFCLFIGLKVKSYGKLVVYSEFCYKYYKEL